MMVVFRNETRLRKYSSPYENTAFLPGVQTDAEIVQKDRSENCQTTPCLYRPRRRNVFILLWTRSRKAFQQVMGLESYKNRVRVDLLKFPTDRLNPKTAFYASYRLGLPPEHGSQQHES